MLAYCGVVLMAAMLCARAGSRWQLGAQSLDTDLDSLLCSPRNYPGIIIDIRESMEKGAELLDGLWTKTVDGCLSGCCNTRGCDLALFKNEGASKTGKNCYYVHCGTVENCVMVQHSSFTTIALLNEDTRSDLSEETRTGHPSRTGHAPMAVTVATTATPTPAPTTATELHTTTAAPSGTTPSSDGPGEVSSPSEDGGVAPSDDVAPSNGSAALGDGDKTPSNGSTPSPGQIKKDPGKSKADDSRGKGSAGGGEVERVQTSGDDDCSKYGCDGSGVVAVVVVGVICFAIVLVVVAILLKKVVDDRRKRKFRNVDYLINGMYT